MKDPAFLFYPGDWMGGTQWMTFEQKGCYMELLILQFNTGKFTESQVKQVLSICFELAWPMLKQKFFFDGEYYWNERLKVEIDKRDKFTESRRINGLSPKKTAKIPDKHMHKHMEDRDRDKNIVVNNTIYGEFSDLISEWLEYKKERKESYKSQRSVGTFVKSLKSLSGENPEIARKIIDQSIGNNWAGIFEIKNKIISHPATSFRPKEKSYDARF